MKYILLISTLLCALIGHSQVPDTLNKIHEVNIIENGLNIPISQQNRNIYVINRTTIESLPARSLQELLQYANGVDLRQRGPFGTQADVSIDGGSFEQTTVLINGAKILDAQTAHNMLNLPIPIDMIERIEVIRGPAARIYGINTLTGAINIVTRKVLKSGVFAQLFAGSSFKKNTEGNQQTFYNSGLQVGTAIKQNKMQHLISAAWDKSNGQRYNTQYNQQKFLYQGDAELNSKNSISTLIGYVNNEFGANGFYAAPADKNSSEAVETFIATLQSQHSLSANWTLQPRVVYRYNFDDYRFLGLSNPTVGRSKHYAHSLAGEIKTTYQNALGMWAFGTELRNEEIKSSNIGAHQRQNLGFFAQLKTILFPRLSLNLGSYVNYNSDYGWQVYPGLDASYEITPSTRIIGNLGSSQRIPSFTDLYLDQRPGNIGNSMLQPENAFQSELGLKITKGQVDLSAYYFHRSIHNFIDWLRKDATFPWQSQNTGTLLTNGINLRSSWRKDFSEGTHVMLQTSYSYLHSKLDRNGDTNSSKYQISNLKHQFTNTIHFQFNSFSFMVANRLNQRMNGKSYWINDLRLNQNFNRIAVSLDAQNIFNTVYYEIGSIPLPSRWISLGIKLKY